MTDDEWACAEVVAKRRWHRRWIGGMTVVLFVLGFLAAQDGWGRLVGWPLAGFAWWMIVGDAGDAVDDGAWAQHEHDEEHHG